MLPLKQKMENPVLTALLSSDILILFCKLSCEARSELLIRCQSKRHIIVLMGRCMFGNYRRGPAIVYVHKENCQEKSTSHASFPDYFFLFLFFIFFFNKIDQS